MNDKTIWASWTKNGVPVGQVLNMKFCTRDDIEELREQADSGTFQLHDVAEDLGDAGH